jgi:hypothetical protein
LYAAWQQATGAAKVAAATAYMSCYKQLGGTEEMRCETKKRVVGREEVIFMSTGCGNLTPKPEDTRKGGFRIASGHPFSDCPVESPKAFIESYDGSQKCRPRVSMNDYGRLLEVMGLPVAPNAEGFKKFMLSGDVKVVECTAELLSKVNMSRTNAAGTAFDFGHTRRECYKYGDKTEKLLVYQKQKTVDETVCIVPPPPAAPVAKPAPTPPPRSQLTPAGCEGLTLYFYVWPMQGVASLGLESEVRRITAQEERLRDASKETVSSTLGGRFRQAMGAGRLTLVKAPYTIDVFAERQGRWEAVGTLQYDGSGAVAMAVPQELMNARMRADFNGEGIFSPPSNEGKRTLFFTPAELKPPVAGRECRRHAHAVTMVGALGSPATIPTPSNRAQRAVQYRLDAMFAEE